MKEKDYERLEQKKQLRHRTEMASKKALSKDDLLKKKKREEYRRMMKRRRMITYSIITVLVISFILLSPLFKIKNISIINAGFTSEDKLRKELENFKGRSIFLYNKNELEDIIKKNPYVDTVISSADITGKLTVTIKEKERAFTIPTKEGILIVDKDLTVLEKVDKNQEELVKVENMVELAPPGSKIVIEEAKGNFLKEYINLMNLNNSVIKFEKINLNSINDIKLYYKDFEILLGDSSNLKDKLNKAINILKAPEMANNSGIINLKFDANPVIQPKGSLTVTKPEGSKEETTKPNNTTPVENKSTQSIEKKQP